MSHLRRLTIATKLTFLFGLFAVLILTGVGVLLYLYGRPALEQAVVSDLRSTASEKQAAFDAWLDDRLKLIVSLSEFPSYRTRVNSLVDDNLDTAARSALRAAAAQDLSEFTGPNGDYTEIMIIQARDGQVLVSTNPDDEGKFLADRPYFIAGSKGPFAQNIFDALAAQTPSLVVSAPIKADDGRVLAVLAATLKVEQMNAIVLRRTGEHATDDAFLVNPAHLFVTQPRFISDPAVLQRGNSTPLVNRCLGGESGTASDLDYRGTPVLAAYRWLPASQLCLVVQIDQAEAFAPTQAFRTTLIVVSGIGLLVGLALAIALARTITSPIRALQRGALRFGRGEFDVRLPETSTDELGTLAREFNAMAGSLADKDADLRAYARELEGSNRQQISEIAERKQAELAGLRRNAELAAFAQLGQALGRLAEPAELLELLYNVIGQVLDNRNLYIALYDDAGQSISFPVYSIDAQRVARPSRALGNGLTEWIIRSKKPLFLPRDVANAALALGVEPQGRPARCYLGVPLLAGDKVIGAVAVQDYEHEDVYDQAHLSLLSTIAAQASIALENARLFAETRRRAEQLQAINDVEQVISTVLDPDVLAARLAQVIHTRLNLPNVEVGLIEKDELVFSAGRLDGARAHSGAGLRLKVGADGITGRVALTGETILVPDVDLDPRFRRYAYWPHTRSELAVALKTQAGVVGVLNLESDEVNAFTPELVRLIETLGAQIAKGIANARLFAETQQLARTDALTGLANRRYLFELGARELSRARRFSHPLSALMLDIDHFKQVNDTHGHAAGDQILKIVARCFMTLVRDSDIVARYGGEEFVIILVETDLAGAHVLAERLRAQVAKTVTVTDQGPLSVTVSLGMTGAQVETDDLPTLLARADSALYSAKQAGRNRVEAA